MPKSVTPKLNIRSLKPLFTHNIGLKVFSVVCALFIYAFVHGDEGQKTISLSVVQLNPPNSANLWLLTPPPSKVDVTVLGPRALLDGITPDEMGSIQIDLRAGRSDRVVLDSSTLSVPAGVTITSISPSTLGVAWDEAAEADVPVQVSLTGSPADGFVVKGPPELTPPTIHARGGKRALGALQFVRAEPYDLARLTEGAHPRVLTIDPPPANVQYEQQTTTATIEIVRKVTERIYRAVQVHVVGSPQAVVFPPRVDVRVVGPADLVEHLRQEQIVPRIDLKEVGANLTKPNSVALPLTLDIENCKTYITPGTVVVKW